MRHPWVNTVLLALLAAQLASGFGGLVSGAERHAWVLWLHGIGAWAIVALLAWKGAVVVQAWRRRRGLSVERAGFALLALLLLATLGTGFLWTTGGRSLVGPYSLMTLHVLLALALAALLLWHVRARRFVLRVPSARGRRAFLRLGAASAAGLAFWLLAGRVASALALPGARRRFTGSYEVGSGTGAFPVVSWLFDAPPPVDLARWRLRVEGAVARPLELSYADVARLADAEAVVTLDCTGGWYSEQAWRGVALGRLLALAGLLPGARSVTVESVSGYGRRFGLGEAERLLLALEVAGRRLDHGHGFPARLVAPERRGYDWVKWVTRVEVNETSELLQPPLPLR